MEARAMSARHPGLADRDRSVLVVIDVQDRLAEVMPRRDEAVSTAVLCVRAAGALRVPIVVTRQYPRGLGDIVPELAAALESASASDGVTLVDKLAFCACEEPAFLEAVQAGGRSQVAIVGMETHICVTQTALALEAAGMSVHVVADGCCSRRDVDHATALDRLRGEGVTVTVAESLLYEWLERAGTDDFRAVLEFVRAR
jgi:nicotinamidase-related amidase